jgi:hypothetical protein
MHKHSLNKLSFLLLGGILLGSYSTANAHWANMNIGTFENKSMSEKLPFGGAFSVNQPDTSELKGRYERRTKLFFGIKDGYWSIAYNDKQPPKGKKTSSNRREFGRFAVTAADEAQNKYTITLYDADYKGVYNSSVKDSPGYDPKARDVPLSQKKVVAVMNLSVDKDKKLVVGKVIEANSEEISYIVGDELPMKAKDTPPNIPQKGSKDSHKHKDHHQHKDHHKHKDHHQHDE